MSRGPGRWQRVILSELQRREVFYVRELLSEDPSRSDQLAAVRAAHRLGGRGLIAISAGRRGWSTRARCTGDRLESLGAVIVARPDVLIDRVALKLAYAETAMGAWLDRRASERANRISDSNAERASLEADRARAEAARAVETYKRKRADAEAELAARWAQEVAQEHQALREALRPSEDEARGLRRRPGALASLIKVLAQEGPITEALILDRAQETLGWSLAEVRDVLDQLQASGHYRRLVEEARP
jgi:hypothetical protein